MTSIDCRCGRIPTMLKYLTRAIPSATTVTAAAPHPLWLDGWLVVTETAPPNGHTKEAAAGPLA